MPRVDWNACAESPLGAYLDEVLGMTFTALYGRWGACHSLPHP